MKVSLTSRLSVLFSTSVWLVIQDAVKNKAGREEREYDSEAGVVKNGEPKKKKAYFQAQSVPPHHTREVDNASTSNFNRKAHHVNVRE